MPIQDIQKIQKKLPLIIAIACGILAILLLNIYLRRKENELIYKAQQAQEAAKPVQPPPVKMGIVLVAQRDIPPQVLITQSDLLIKEVPVEFIQPSAVIDLDSVIGQISAVPITAGEQILKTNLLPPGKIGKSLAQITPEGKRAITVLVDNSSKIVDLIKPGDYVDVFVLIAPPGGPAVAQHAETTERLVPLFQGIEVLAVGGKMVAKADTTEKKETRGGLTETGSNAVTFALSPQDAVLFSFVQEHGKIKLTLRSSEDTQKEPIKPADWDSLLRYLYPEKNFDMEGKQPVVEIYRGATKEVIPLPETKK